MRFFAFISALLLCGAYTTSASADVVLKRPWAEADYQCMALNAYHEARGEPLGGMVAVSQVVMHRLRSPNYPDDVCGVIQENRTPVPGLCQFSWYCDGRSDAPLEHESWRIAQAVARAVLDNPAIPDLVEGSRNYARCDVSVLWTRSMRRVGRIGEHCFYHDGIDDESEKPLKDVMQEAIFTLASVSRVGARPQDYQLVMVKAPEAKRRTPSAVLCTLSSLGLLPNFFAGDAALEQCAEG